MKLINRMSDYIYALAEWADYEEKVRSIVRAVADRIEPSYTNSEMTLELAGRLLEVMKAKADDGGVPMAMAVTDSRGGLVLFARQEDVLPVSIGLAQKKAFTATQLKCPTSDLAAVTKPGAMLWGLQADPGLVVFGGGFPLWKDGRVFGAVGVSGGTVDEDVTVAEAAVDIWDKIKN
jgi:uncharacterized protein GlcG (DUF336 family)